VSDFAVGWTRRSFICSLIHSLENTRSTAPSLGSAARFSCRGGTPLYMQTTQSTKVLGNIYVLDGEWFVAACE